MFEYNWYCNIHVYCPGVEADEAPGPFFFRIINIQSNCSFPLEFPFNFSPFQCKKVQVGNDQENAKSENDSHSKNRGGKNLINNQVLIP